MKYSDHMQKFASKLEEYGIACEINEEELICQNLNKKAKYTITKVPTSTGKTILPFDLVVTAPDKLASIICSALSMNKRVFARNCKINKIDKLVAENFLNRYHLMGSTTSAYNYGLFKDEELVAVATYSKGRKMDRLSAEKRSYELIRFCSLPGLTVTGGLTKLVKNFYNDKKAGDVMTYIDKQLSKGTSFIEAGFKEVGETPPNYFLVNKKTFKRTYLKDKSEAFDHSLYYLSHNLGNRKLIFTTNDKE